jgi:hypothetical protein
MHIFFSISACTLNKLTQPLLRENVWLRGKILEWTLCFFAYLWFAMTIQKLISKIETKTSELIQQIHTEDSEIALWEKM